MHHVHMTMHRFTVGDNIAGLARISERRAYMLSYAFLATSKVTRPTSPNPLVRMQYFWHFGSICQFDAYPHRGDQTSLARVRVMQLQHAA
jgi:hypothetical protein